MKCCEMYLPLQKAATRIAACRKKTLSIAARTVSHFCAKVIRNSPVRSLFQMQRDSVELSPFSHSMHRSAMK